MFVLFLYSRVISKLALPPHADADINLEGFLLPVSNESYFHPLSPTFQRKIGSGSGVEREGKVGGRMAAISQSISQYFYNTIDQGQRVAFRTRDRLLTLL